MKTATPTKICAVPPQLGSTGATSAPKAERHTDTRCTSMSSSAQPVKGTAPVTPVRLFTGVSTTPNGRPSSRSHNVNATLIGPAASKAPVTTNVIAPFTVAPAARPPAETTLRDRFAEPVPEAGLTCSHGWFVVAVHVTVPDPLCVNRTTCAAVCARNAAPFVTAANRSDVLSSVIVGSVPLPLPGMFRAKMSHAPLVSPLTRLVEDDGKAMTPAVLVDGSSAAERVALPSAGRDTYARSRGCLQVAQIDVTLAVGVIGCESLQRAEDDESAVPADLGLCRLLRCCDDGTTATGEVTPVWRSWMKAPMPPPGSKLVADDSKQTNLPSLLNDPTWLSPFACVPPGPTLTRDVVPVWTSSMNTSDTPLVSPGTRLAAAV